MNIADAKQQVKDTVEAYLAKDGAGLPRIPLARQRPVFLIGAPGIGKTAIMEQVASELGIGLVSYSMTHHTRQSALGLPFIVHREYHGSPCDVSEYTMSEIIASVYDYMEATGLDRGILFLDEINCVSETLYPSMLQFLQFKTFGRHRVPDGWVVVCAGNPPEYNKSVHEFDIVTLDRLRKIEVEPEYAAWRAYALESGVHPAVTSFLEVRPECFYSVESTPRGKSFVTARGWDDLSDVIGLFEDLGKPVDERLVSQFLQDPEIAERFAVYYGLFSKYRSDYQIDAIIAGEAPEAIYERARAAEFDERLALLNLVLDALVVKLGAAVEREDVTARVRDVLREAKPELLDGASLADAVEGRVASLVDQLERRAGSGTMTRRDERCERLAIDALKDLCVRCKLARATEGAGAFERINAEYRSFVAELEPMVADAGSALDNAFAFVDRAFGDGRESAVFATELTARRATSLFINRFGSESYYAHNDSLKTDERRRDLVERIGSLGIAPETAVAAGADGIEAASAEEGRAAAAHPMSIDEYYRDAVFEYGFASLCKMSLPDGLEGKTVLDIGCRRGKGVFKLSERVGDAGHVIGVDWVPAFIDEARERSDRAWRESGLSGSNMEFYVAYPEDLQSVGLDDECVDVVFANCSINLAYDMNDAFREIFRVLVPGGLLVCDTVVADGPREVGVMERARAIGNGVQAAPSRALFESMLSSIGFGYARWDGLHEVKPSDGALADSDVPFVASPETVTFKAGVALVGKPAL